MENMYVQSYHLTSINLKMTLENFPSGKALEHRLKTILKFYTVNSVRQKALICFNIFSKPFLNSVPGKDFF